MDEPYWSTSISEVGPNRITIRGYPLEELVGEISYVDAIALCLKGDLPGMLERRCLDAVLTSAIDHQFVNSTVLAARTVVSGNPDPVVGIAAGVMTFGSITGGAPAHVIEILDDLDRRCSEGATADEAAREIVLEHRSARRRIPGMGHPLHPRVDTHYTSRSRALYSRVISYGLSERRLSALEAVHDNLIEVLGTDLPINVDGVIGAVLAELGYSSLQAKAIAPFTLLPGIAAHVVEEIEHGTPLRVVSDAGYTGSELRHLPARGMETR